MNLLIRLAVSSLGTAAVVLAYFFFKANLIRRKAGKIAIAQALIDETARKAARASLTERAAAWAAVRGISGSGHLVMAAFVLIYGFTALALLVVTGNQLTSLLVGAPASAAVVWVVITQVGSRRKKAFDRQLLTALNMLAGLVESGLGPQRALEQIAASLPNPMHTELGRALDTARTSRDLTGALRDLYHRYPSRAFELFITALEIDQDMGGRIEPALRQAATMMQRDFDLVNEAKSEISQAQMEFYCVLGIMAFISWFMISGNDDRSIYTSPFAIILITIGVINIGVGLLRGANIFRRAGGLERVSVRSLLRRRQAEDAAPTTPTLG